MKFLIWDLPTRFFHWLLVFSVFAAFGVAEWTEKDTSIFYLHVVFGVLAGLLIIWRLIWGFAGSRHSRWNELFFPLPNIVGYFKESLSGKSKYYAGHNPGGAIVVLGILLLIACTVLTGILSPQDEIFEDLHENLPIFLMVLVAIHIAGVLLATKVHKENYALAMVTGIKRGTKGDSIPHNSFVALIMMLILVLGSWMYFIKGFDRNTALFTAPGTQWTFQVGDPEANESK
jgi:cytochrome b